LKRIAMTGVMLVTLSGSAYGTHTIPIRGGQECLRPDGRPVLFTVRMGVRAADAVYSKPKVTGLERRFLSRLARCQRNPAATPDVRSYIKRARANWSARYAVSWNGPVIASWYDDAGSTACGFHATYGFASLILPCGAQIVMRGPGGEVTAVMQDHGPYVSGRTFDLNPALKSALGCGDLCTVSWAMR
jgi:hypothetical protein